MCVTVVLWQKTELSPTNNLYLPLLLTTIDQMVSTWKVNTMHKCVSEFLQLHLFINAYKDLIMNACAVMQQVMHTNSNVRERPHWRQLSNIQNKSLLIILVEHA